MKSVIALALVGSAAAFAPASQGPVSTALNAKKGPSLKYVPCISTADLPAPGSATSGVAGGLAICIAVDPKGAVYALGDKCPPVNQPLSFGKVGSDGTIADPVLGTKFSLKSGQVIEWCPTGLGKLIEVFSTLLESPLILSRPRERMSRFRLMLTSRQTSSKNTGLVSLMPRERPTESTTKFSLLMYEHVVPETLHSMAMHQPKAQHALS